MAKRTADLPPILPIAPEVDALLDKLGVLPERKQRYMENVKVMVMTALENYFAGFGGRE